MANMTAPTIHAALRRQLLLMVVGIAAVSAVAIGLYYLLHIKLAAPSTQRVFTAIWTLGNLAAVMVPLSRMRKIRRSQNLR